MHVTISADDPRPSYAQIADHLRAAIQAGQYSAGERRLPAIKTLAAEYDVAPMTVYKALDILTREGYIVAQQGRGTFVREVLPSTDEDQGNKLDAVNRRIDELAEALKAISARSEQEEIQELRRTVARLENLLIDLYSRTGEDYPHERLGEDGDEHRRRIGA